MTCEARWDHTHHTRCELPAHHEGWHRRRNVRWGGGSEVADRHDRSEARAEARR